MVQIFPFVPFVPIRFIRDKLLICSLPPVLPATPVVPSFFALPSWINICAFAVKKICVHLRLSAVSNPYVIFLTKMTLTKPPTYVSMSVSTAQWLDRAAGFMSSLNFEPGTLNLEPALRAAWLVGHRRRGTQPETGT